MRRVLIAVLAWLLATPALGQVPYFPQTLPPSTVVGNLLATPQPTQAITFSQLASAIFSGPVGFGTTNPNTGVDIQVGITTGVIPTLNIGNPTLGGTLFFGDSVGGSALNFITFSNNQFAISTAQTLGLNFFTSFSAITPVLHLDSTGSIKINGATGTSGQILTSAGGSNPPYWAAFPGVLVYTLPAVNFNSANTDNPITIALPTWSTRYNVNFVVLSHPSIVITTATVGIFTATGGGGVAIANNQAVALTQTADATNGNSQSVAINNSQSTTYQATTIYLRIGTAQGSAATADATIFIRPMP